MNKNWNDRADKDLFFTILSTKNIGVISGQEWTIIGNTMRVLGYGFTNEGCRQHFQGLRRAQNKADTTSAMPENNPQRLMDPTLNPITRRPGPGRGRPRKVPLNGESGDDISESPAENGPPALAGPAPDDDPQVDLTQVSPPDIVVGASPVLDTASIPVTVTVPMVLPLPISMSMPEEVLVPAPESPAMEDANGEDDDDDQLDEQPAKRQRLDTSTVPSLEDEVVLNVLNAHNNPTSVDPYAQEFGFGEA